MTARPQSRETKIYFPSSLSVSRCVELKKWQVREFKVRFFPFNSHSEFVCCAKFDWEDFSRDVLGLWVRKLLNNSLETLQFTAQCSYSPADWRMVPQKQATIHSGNYLCVGTEAAELCFGGCCDKLCIYTLLRWDYVLFFYFHAHCSVFIAVNQCFNHYLFIKYIMYICHSNDRVVEHYCYFLCVEWVNDAFGNKESLWYRDGLLLF